MYKPQKPATKYQIIKTNVKKVAKVTVIGVLAYMTLVVYAV